MQASRRYRLIIYFAALVLCLSVCFAYAEEPAAVNAAAMGDAGDAGLHLLYYGSAVRSSFLEPSTVRYQQGAASAAAPTADAALAQLTNAHRERNHRGFLRHRSELRIVAPARASLNQAANQASIK